jgi:hypothetical protein
MRKYTDDLTSEVPLWEFHHASRIRPHKKLEHYQLVRKYRVDPPLGTEGKNAPRIAYPVGAALLQTAGIEVELHVMGLGRKPAVNWLKQLSIPVRWKTGGF